MFKYLIVARLLPQGGSSLSRTYVMLCNTDKHVTGVHYNDPGTILKHVSPALLQLRCATQAHLSARKHFGS